MHDRKPQTSPLLSSSPEPRAPSLTRRRFLAGAAGAIGGAGLVWTPAHAEPAGSPACSLPTPPSFPQGIPLYQQAYENWSGEIALDAVFTAVPESAADIVRLANWAAAYGYTLRPRGAKHGWTPLTVVSGAPVTHVVLVDTMAHLNAISVSPASSPATVTAGAGATLEAILSALESHGLGWFSVPAVGELSIAGALAVDAHGAALPAVSEVQTPGTTYGSLSNLVTELTAVVWDPAAQAYALRTFSRSDPQITALLTHLGRAFITSVTLQAGANDRLRCQSHVNIPWSVMFAPPGAPLRTFEKYLAASGRAEAIWFPFTACPWLKVWTKTPNKPLLSRQVFGPYNYPFSDNIPEFASDFIQQVNLGITAGTPSFGAAMYALTAAGLTATLSSDIWGWSKDLLFYIRATTIRLTEGGGAVITSRANAQQVIHDFAAWFEGRMSYYQSQGKYPVNGPVEIRCCGLDQPADVAVPSAGPPTISATRPRPDHPEWDTAIWLNVLGIPGTPGMFAFYREMEQWMYAHFSGSYATFRPEWSKGWAFSEALPYKDKAMISTTVPDVYRAGVPVTESWDTARAALSALDPARVFSNTFLDELLP